LLLARGKSDEAEAILHKAAVTARKVLPAQFFGRGVILQSWAEALVATGHYRDALDPLNEAYAIITTLDPHNPGLSHAVQSYVTIYEHIGDAAKAAVWKAKLEAGKVG